jgi:hypothetical protein
MQESPKPARLSNYTYKRLVKLKRDLELGVKRASV